VKAAGASTTGFGTIPSTLKESYEILKEHKEDCKRRKEK